MDAADALRLFGLNNLSIESDIRRVEVEQRIDFGHQPKKNAEQEQQY